MKKSPQVTGIRSPEVKNFQDCQLRIRKVWVFLEHGIWVFPNPQTWNCPRASQEFSNPWAFLWLDFKVALESAPQICRAGGRAWNQSPRSCLSRIWETISPVPRVGGCWLLGGTGGVSRKLVWGKWAGVDAVRASRSLTSSDLFLSDLHPLPQSSLFSYPCFSWQDGVRW